MYMIATKVASLAVIKFNDILRDSLSYCTVCFTDTCHT